MAGAKAVLESTPKVTATNENREFSLNNVTDDNLKIRVSYVGYQSLIAEVRK